MNRPVLIYDGDCGFCRLWVERWKHVTGEHVDYETSQASAHRFPRIDPRRFQESVVFVAPDERVSFGAEAVFRALAYARGGRMWLAAYRRVPGFAVVTEAAYALVARHRATFSRITRLLWGKHVAAPQHALVRWAVLRGLGLVDLIAFVSMWVQIEGLIGSRGILPLAPWLDGVAARMGGAAWYELPTLFWFGAGDRALNVVCAAGTAASAMLLLNLLPGPAAVVAWACYLSLFVAGRVFLGFQWDILLLEAGVIAMLWAPWRLRPRIGVPSSRFPLWLTRWLVFRLMFLSGFVKLASHDPSWRNLTAMAYHYETQPLPAWTSWYAYHLPLAVHRAETAATFVIELGMAFLVFTPRRPRLLAFIGFVALQVLIGATGNYGFFNLLTIVLCLSLLDDAYVRPWLRPLLSRGAVDERLHHGIGHVGAQLGAASSARAYRVRATRAWVALAAAFLFVLSGAHLVGRVAGIAYVPDIVRDALAATEPLQLTSNYGLFAVMTKERPEIIVEGSDDGVTWKPYEFRWKPGDPARRPRFVEPHMPRLDWQMWFAALGTLRSNPWLVSFMERLLQGAPPVLSLLASDPFEGRPPNYVRAVLYDYRFTEPGAPAAAHDWWVRADPRPYSPVLRLRSTAPPPSPSPSSEPRRDDHVRG